MRDWAAVILLTLALAASASGCQTADPEPIFAEVFVDPVLVKKLAGSPPDLETDVEAHAAFIGGRRFLKVALERPEIARIANSADGTSWIAGQIRVKSVSPDHLRIIYIGPPSNDGASLVNCLAAAYIDEMHEMTSRLRAERVSEVEGALRDVSSRLREKRLAIEHLDHRLKAARPTPGAETGPIEPDQINLWTTELDKLQKAVVQGEEIDARLAAELAELKHDPQQPGVGLVRMAELH
jgi:hypothetical protein